MLLWGLTATALSIYALIRFNKKPSKTATSYATHKSSGMFITKPNSDSNSFNVIYVFGGINYATSEWMKAQMPQSYFLNNVVVIANYTDSFKTVRDRLQEFMTKNNLKQKNVSVLGFSAGGINVLNGYSKDYKVIGLIDPSNKPEHTDISFGNNVYMIYNINNWGAYPTIQKNMKRIAEAVNRGGSISSSIDMKHKDIPQYFFKKMESVLIR